MRFLSVFVLGIFLIVPAQEYRVDIVPKNMSVKEKKKRFFTLVAPAVLRVYHELQKEFEDVRKTLLQGQITPKIDQLKKIYKVKTDKELLLALKPHPPSIALAQAAMESAWGTSRFFVEANNIFGMWANTDKVARIAASQKREDGRTIWLRKYASLEESVRSYYKTMGRNPAYKEFRDIRYKTNDPYEIVKKLNRYSEMGEEYTQKIASVIRYNKLQRYDTP